MVEHKLHRLIGETIFNANLKDCFILRDTACGGNHALPLFCCEDRSNKTEFGDGDVLIIKNNKTKVIVEIEEANTKPTQICGKLLTSALSSFCIYGKETIEMDNNTLFIQILDNSKLKGNSSKEGQWNNLEKAISNIVPIKGSKIKKYKLFFGNSSQFDFDSLIKYLEDFLSK